VSPRAQAGAARAAGRIAELPTAMGMVARQAWGRARSRGVNVRPLALQARLSLDQLQDPRTRLPVRNQIDFLNLVADALDDDLLGFNLALEFELRKGGLFYYVLASSGKLREVFERGARFTSLVNEGVLQKCVDGRRVGMVLRYAGVRRQEDRHQIEFWLVTLVRICRRITGVEVKPARVRVTHHRGREGTRLAKFMGCAVEFGAAADEILFERSCAELPVIAADPYLNRLLVEMCEQTLARQRRAQESFATRVENAVAPRLPHGKARAGAIAAEFGMSERTFARRLSGEGTTFSQLVDRLRLDLARRYLLNENLSISKIAWLLGYQEVGAFTHAFRRWTGKSPSEVARRR
jgi:AraC-like DNA-binding protein